MFDFDGAFGAYIFHDDEIKQVISAFVDAYNQGQDINDSEIASSICSDIGISLSNFSDEELERMSQEIERLI